MIASREKAFALYELVQNAWDENVKFVDVQVVPAKDDPDNWTLITVSDDHPDGFRNLAHAYTLFAGDNQKRKDPTKRGRFNLGEKLVLALARRATIKSTKGTVFFNDKGRTQRSDRTTDAGSVVEMEIEMNVSERAQAIVSMFRLITPPDVRTSVNGEVLGHREPVRTFRVKQLESVVEKGGKMGMTRRTATVSILEPVNGQAYLYEMGIPIVDIPDRWDVDVSQKIPLTMDRDNVPPRYLRRIRTEVVSNCHDLLMDSDVSEPWVREATSEKEIAPGAFRDITTRRLGKKLVIRDGKDLQANNLAVSKGYGVISGGNMTKGEWDNARDHMDIKRAGLVTPSHSTIELQGGLNGKQYDTNADMDLVAAFTREFGLALLDFTPTVDVICEITIAANAMWGQRTMTYNVGRLGKSWFEDDGELHLRVVDLCIHEFAHHFEGNHLDDGYYRALTRLGARAVEVALANPALFFPLIGKEVVYDA